MSSRTNFHQITTESEIFNEVFTFKRNLFIVFIVKNIDLRVIVEVFLMRAKIT